MYDLFGDEIPIYTKRGYKIFRRTPEQSESCGNLMDLGSVHTLFENPEPANGEAETPVNFHVYPLAFTRSLGNVQADGCISPFKRRLNRLDYDIRRRLQELAAHNDEDGRYIPPIYRLLFPICSQIYHLLCHRLRRDAKFHLVQLGLMTSLFSGTNVARAALKALWSTRFRLCNNGLPHERFDQKVSGDDQPECMRFENTYRIDVFRIPEAHRNGR